MLIVLLLCGVLGLGLYRVNLKFGSLPYGARLERIERSPNYAAGQFHNQTATPLYSGEKMRWSSLLKMLFGGRRGSRPAHTVPTANADLKALDKDTVVWLGHSSLFLRLGGKNVLIDPVLGKNAAPLFFLNRAFKQDRLWQAGDFPVIDVLIISHDHWDHLDYPTLMALKDKIKSVVCPLGVGAHLERWGFDPKIIHETDWYESVAAAQGLTVHTLPARHFSGRGMTRNKTLWAGFLLETRGRRVFYSGDGGYGPHFAEAGRRFGPIDLAILENGQYNTQWRNVHMMPEETVRAALDLRAKELLPVHAGKFVLSVHAWDEPFKRVAAAAGKSGVPLLTPMIGEAVPMDGPTRRLTAWWEYDAKESQTTGAAAHAAESASPAN